ncbi:MULTISPECIES: PD-(D/E)XK nuclease family transposase [Bacteria]|uniref:PD-(D/E)XK nuclease family transposase n=1 Tax=Bacteria TaxID=2 RepID=UPI00132C12F2|nr:hypothetical protein [Parabacteroides distasonis]MZK52090.1 hypothetical protein [Clostridium beijerinckii]MZK60231.1 hypothetical protein [Clostridium beijerinckii]MZK70516.1 hypothetical protein [Clostridium beijerinckii]MZK75818.1 hypothetical protein [Clostridium beijerinckii]
MKSLLDPKVDFVFKNIFGSQKSPQILISFLNAILKSKYPIVKVNIKNTDLEKHFLDDNLSRLDVKAKTINDETVALRTKLEIEKIRQIMLYL